MALFTPSESPAVVVKEIDLTGGVPNVQSTTGAIAGNFRWGPVEERVKIANETELVSTFASPDSTNTIDFHSASYFLRYSNSLEVVRTVTSQAANAFSSTLATLITGGEVIDGDSNTGGLDATPIISNTKYSADSQITLRRAKQVAMHAANFETIKNKTEWASVTATLADTTEIPTLKSDSDGVGNFLFDSAATQSGNNTFMALYPGELGNSLEVSLCPPNTTAFNAWDYKSAFDGAPTTSTFVEGNPGSANSDEVHIAVIDNHGTITGTKGSVLETYPYVSIINGAKNADGTDNYAINVVNSRSSYVRMLNFDSNYTSNGAGSVLNTASDNRNFLSAFDAPKSHLFINGRKSGVIAASDYAKGHDLFEDKDQVEVDFLISPSMTGSNWETVVNDLIATAEARKDCVVTMSPPRDTVVNVINTSDIVTNTVAKANAVTKRSSYSFMDNNFLKVYDKYNDQFIHIPAASSTAGLMAMTDRNRAPWFSPAGARRGGYLGITSISYSPTKTQRDTLYKASVNPIANIPGQGTLLFGDKTMLNRSSAFDRINVRRLFLVLERAIARAAEQVLFEFNDEFTRAEFVNIIEPVLREVKGRRGITDFRVVADDTNNTAAVIDRNEFIANIFIKPARSINYVTLNFVAVRTGVDFEEVVGTV